MLYTQKPENFSPRFEIVSCFFELDDTFLMLHRLPTKSEGSRWGVPGGKIDPGESAVEAVIREVNEETGITLNKKNLTFIEKLYVRYDTHDFVYNMFKTSFTERANITLRDSEHNGYVWVKPEEALKLDLITDMPECIKRVYEL